MVVYYTATGHAYHYYKDCPQLQKNGLGAINASDKEDLDRHVCLNCKTRQSLVEQ